MLLKIIPLPYKIEKFIINNFDKTLPYLYYKINKKELDNIIILTKNKFKNWSNYINPELIKSIRSIYVKNYMIEKSITLNKNKNNIINDYNILTIEQLVIKYDISPLNILRIIFYDKYKQKLNKLILHTEKLDELDNNNLKYAIETDAYALINHSESLKNAIEFEKQIELFLKKNNIKYETQNDLIKKQLMENKNITITPDFLIKSPLIINGIEINWIDAKNYYGSNIRMVIKNIYKQTKKYIKAYGNGCIVFKLGFNDKLKFDNILIIDYNSIKEYK